MTRLMEVARGSLSVVPIDAVRQCLEVVRDLCFFRRKSRKMLEFASSARMRWNGAGLTASTAVVVGKPVSKLLIGCIVRSVSGSGRD